MKLFMQQSSMSSPSTDVTLNFPEETLITWFKEQKPEEQMLFMRWRKQTALNTLKAIVTEYY